MKYTKQWSLELMYTLRHWSLFVVISGTSDHPTIQLRYMQPYAMH